MIEQFTARAEAVSAEVLRVTGRQAALDTVTRLLSQEGVTGGASGASAVWIDGPFLNARKRQNLREFPGLSFDVTRERAAEARIGISEMTWALADTGSVAQDSSAIEQRLVSTLPAIHVAILPAAGILPDMPALLAKIDPAECAYLAMITGPSRTADIERVLTIGVHGPERLVIVLVDEPGGEER